MQKTAKKYPRSFRDFRKVTPVAVVAIASILVVGTSFVQLPRARADQYDEKIQALQNQNAANSNAVADLASQATSYQDAINQLQSQISAIQSIISSNEAKQADLQNQIDTNQVELEKQRKVLGENIKMMYVDGQPSTIEMLASSKNLSDFVDKEEYRTSVRNKIQDTLKKIADLQNQLNDQKEQVQTLIASQKSQQSKLDSARAEQAKLLAYNESQQADYNAKTQENQSKIAQLRSEQAAANARLFAGATVVTGSACDSSHGDTYPTPWCNSTQDSMTDNWGMYNRECVSYTAWKVYESGRHMPNWGGYGNANQWDDNARAAGIPVDGNPRPGDVAIKNSMPYGHAMYVESVNSDGTINISQYNQQLNGQFSRAYNLKTADLVFIHFP